MYPAPYGALTQLWAGTMPEAATFNGEVRARVSSWCRLISDGAVQFLIPWARVGKCRHEMYDPKETEKLWAWLEGAVKPAAE